jgi:putative peptidoglycan lipid II flippase
MTAQPKPASRATDPPRIGRLAGAALLLSVSFLLSRVLGVLRTVVIAGTFGDSRAIEAYFAAFRIPDTMFMLVSGGALASAFVPMFAGLLERDREDEAWEVANSVLTTVVVALAGLALIAFVFAPQLMDALVGEYPPGDRSLTINLTRIMLLQPIFLGLAAIMNSILQAYHRFTLTAIAPLFYNLSVIVGALLGRWFGVGALAWAVVAGGLLQVLVQLPGMSGDLRRYYRISLDWSSGASREVLRLL